VGACGGDSWDWIDGGVSWSVWRGYGFDSFGSCQSG
jgi:hypothetical protein